MNEEEKKAVEKLTNGEKITLTELIRKIKKEGIERFIVTRPEYVYIILNLIEKLQKENEELKIVKSAIQTLQINSMEDEKYIVISKSSFFDGSYKHLLDEFIPIQKVKDKIEEIQKDKDSKYYDMFLETRDIEYVVEILQELLRK